MGRRILIIEDHAALRERMHTLLQSWGHTVAVAKDGREGVQQALHWLPDVALVDIGLPVLDGYEVARRVRAALSDRIRLIAVTANRHAEGRQAALDAGFDHLLTKPLDLEQLADLLAG